MNSRGLHDRLRSKGLAGSVHSQLLRALPARTGHKWPAAILGGATTPGSPPFSSNCVALVLPGSRAHQPGLRMGEVTARGVRASRGRNEARCGPAFLSSLSAGPLLFVSAGNSGRSFPPIEKDS